MREQTASHIPPRASRTVDHPSPQRVGHYAGIHPEDQPYQSDDIEEDDSYYPQRMPSSARRYTTRQGHQVIQQGNKRIVIHEELPPKKGRPHWIVFLCSGMLLMVLAWVALGYVGNWWTNMQDTIHYGFPRVYQVDQFVGQGDSTEHPTHFLFENLNGRIVIIQIPGNQINHARIYAGPTLYSANADLIPITAEFSDVNGDGKIDLILHVGDQKIIWLNDGTQFKPQQ